MKKKWLPLLRKTVTGLKATHQSFVQTELPPSIFSATGLHESKMEKQNSPNADGTAQPLRAVYVRSDANAKSKKEFWKWHENFSDRLTLVGIAKRFT